MRQCLTVILLLLLTNASAQFKGIIINEFSQGDAGNREYIELLVVGNKTCNDSVADIRGWIFDDQNGWYGNSNASNGHYRFKDIPQWAAVPYGSIILVYNSASGQKNLSITAPDDLTDANKDYAYILPINSSAYLDEHDNEPTNISGPAYIYPAASSGAGYAGTSNTWINHIALNNTGGDVLSVISKTRRDSAFFSIGYGYAINSGFRLPTVSIADVTAGNNARLTDSNYTLASQWAINPVPAFETPGSANGGINTLWIQKMRTQPVAQTTFTAACSNGPYLFYGQTITTSGPHRVLTNTAYGCVDTNDLYVVIERSEVSDTIACDSLVYKGITYKNNTAIVDIIKSLVIDCDSLVRTLNVRINKSSASLTQVCMGAGQSYMFNNQPIISSGNYSFTLTNASGCDSVARLRIVFKTERNDTVRGCGSVALNGQTYIASTTLFDTTKSLMITGCDSVINKTVIIINSIHSNFFTACASEGSAYNFLGTPLTATGFYSSALQTIAGCDSTISLYIVFTKTNVQNFTGCDSAVVSGIKYFQSVFLSDTVRSLISGCDSIITVKNIVVNQTKRTYSTYCTSAASFNFNGQLVTATGFYSQTLSTSAGCDSIVSLYIVLTKTNTQTFAGCDSVVAGGTRYFQSIVLRDTSKSIVTGCDSLITVKDIIVNTNKRLNFTVCTPSANYNFNGQVLTTGGFYIQHFTTSTGCDSLVQLYLVVTKASVRNITGCGLVTFNGNVYTNSTLISDTIKSAVTGCDSLISTVNIQVSNIADLNVSKDTVICKGDTVTLFATSVAGAVSWTGFGPGNAITIAPATTTVYTATSFNGANCTNSKTVVVTVEDFNLSITNNASPVLPGARIHFETSANYSYDVLKWEPAYLFGNQTAKKQQLIIDSSLFVYVVAQSKTGCKDTAYSTIVVSPLNDIYIPSAFTPNGDGKNDDVRVIGQNIKAFNFKIFNRWGQMIFSTSDKSKSWDGTASGKLQPTGTYVYVVRVTLASGQVKEKKGTITLLR